MLKIEPVRTALFHLNQNLSRFILDSIPSERIQEGSLLAVTSKIVSLAEGRVVPREAFSKEELVRREADQFLGEIGYGCFLTIKEGMLIPSSGIDESNSESGGYILYPQDPFASTERLYHELRAAWKISKLGIILTDSHTTPLRRGVTGISLAWAGFRPLKNMIGSKDLFGRELQMTQMNLADGISAAAVMLMGEGAECCPLAIIDGAAVEFSDQVHRKDLHIPLQEDLYFPILKK